MNLIGRVLWFVMAGLLATVAVSFYLRQSSHRGIRSESRASALPSGNRRHARQTQEAKTARGLLGRRVEGNTGETLGVLNDLVIDTRSGRIIFVVLTSGGFAGMGARLKAAPPGTLSPDTAKRDIVAMAINPQSWEHAPVINKHRLAELENPTTAQTIYQYYQQPWPAADGQAGYLKLASDLIGQSVVNNHGQEVGRVSDLYVEFGNPATTRAIFEPATNSRPLAVPVNAFIINGNGNSLILHTGPQPSQHADETDVDISLHIAGAQDIGFDL